jgi:NAD+ synthase
LQNKDQIERAHNHALWLKSKFSNVDFYEIDMTHVFKNFELAFEEKFSKELGFANSKSRIRMVALYQISASINGVVVGTGNKVEDFGVGFYTKYGDGGVDISPIGDLTKTEVRSLSRDLEINQEILQAKPTDGLWDDDRSDEDQIGASYEELEWAMSTVESNDVKELSERQKEVLNIFLSFNKRNKHKMIPIPVFKK